MDRLAGAPGVTFSVNGRPRRVVAEDRTSLLDALRDELNLTGAHAGCEQGACGCCNVRLDGRLVRSCLLFANQLEGAEITTIEGVATGEDLHPVQQAFCDRHALQCGYCTPGMVMTVVALLEETPQPTEAEVDEALSGNLCRCTGYEQIRAAVRDVVDTAR